MRRTLLAVLAPAVLLVGAATTAQQDAAAAPARTAVAARVDPRVELLSIVFRLAGSPEYSQGRVERYTKAVDEHFAPFKDHDVVKHARRLRAARGVSYDAVAAFAVHLDGIDKLGEAVPFEPRPQRLDERWTTADARRFLDDLRDFAEQSHCREFFAGQRELYAHAEQAMQQTFEQHADLAWFDRFFGARPSARFQVALGLLNGGGNYGPSVLHQDGSEDLYCILGCWETDAQGMPVFGKPVVATVAHEFCHWYCNPLVDRHLPDLLPAGEQLYALVREPMQSQAYGNARTLLCESLVRACVVRYVAATQDAKAAAAEIAEQERRSFPWTRGLADLLTTYEQQRAQYPTLDAFAPKLAAFFASQPAVVEALLAQQHKNQPKVTSIVPADGREDVDPATKAIVVTFDRPMRDQSWSVVGGGEHFPKLGAPSYDAARKVLTIPCTLQPDWRYEFWLNSGKFTAFRSAEGEPLPSMHVAFHTAGKRP